jgi:hypothetical protein
MNVLHVKSNTKTYDSILIFQVSWNVRESSPHKVCSPQINYQICVNKLRPTTMHHHETGTMREEMKLMGPALWQQVLFDSTQINMENQQNCQQAENTDFHNLSLLAKENVGSQSDFINHRS